MAAIRRLFRPGGEHTGEMFQGSPEAAAIARIIPGEKPLCINPGVYAVATALGLDLDLNHPHDLDRNWDQNVAGVRWTIQTNTDGVRTNWINHWIRKRDGTTGIMAFESNGAQMSITLEAMPETLAAALVGRRLSDILATRGLAADPIIRNVDVGETRTRIEFGYQPYRTISELTAPNGIGRADIRD